jgi:predicted transcriptional regulator
MKKTFYDQEKFKTDIRTIRIIDFDENQSNFCKRCRISLGTLNKIENSRPVTLLVIMNVCSAVNLDYKNYLI